MRTLEIKKIGLGSVFRFLFVAGSLSGFLIGTGMIILGISLRNIGLQLDHRFNADPLEVGALLTGVFLGSPIYGFFLGLGGIAGAWIYNRVASLIGGIILEVNDR